MREIDGSEGKKNEVPEIGGVVHYGRDLLELFLEGHLIFGNLADVILQCCLDLDLGSSDDARKPEYV